MHRLIGVVSLLNFALLGSLPAQQVIPPFARWEAAPSTVCAGPGSGFSRDTLPLPHRDYRYEGPDQLPVTEPIRPSLIPDSTRIRVGYQHWKGAAIGAGAGGLIGTLLVIAAGRGCSDCNTTGSDYLRAISLAAGLGGTFGFLVGLASPRYQ